MHDKLVSIAMSQVGVREIGGNNCGPKVREYQAATELPPGRWPWCAAFVDWCLREWLKDASTQTWLNLKTTSYNRWLPKTAAAFGFLKWAKNRAETTKILSSKDRPKPGDIVVYDFSHVGIVTDALANSIEAVEGNTNGRGDRDSTSGDGVWLKSRRKSLIQAFVRIHPSTLK